MRLFTHNFLQCHVRNCTASNFPLRILDAEIDHKDTEYNADFMRAYINKIHWDALLKTVQELELGNELPAETPEEPYDDQLLQQLHGILFETCVRNGRMVCNGCGHVYPIKDGIPNMLLAEDEV